MCIQRIWSAMVMTGLGLAMLACPGKVPASGILFQVDTIFPTDPSPGGSAPWVDAIFQEVSPGTLAAGGFIAGNGGGLCFSERAGWRQRPVLRGGACSGLSGGNSTWVGPSQATLIPVPEPTTTVSCLLGLAALVCSWQLRRVWNV